MLLRNLFFLSLVLLAPVATAIETKDIPKELQSWIPWVLEGKGSINCPFEYKVYKDLKAHHCHKMKP